MDLYETRYGDGMTYKDYIQSCSRTLISHCVTCMSTEKKVYDFALSNFILYLYVMTSRLSSHWAFCFVYYTAYGTLNMQLQYMYSSLRDMDCAIKLPALKTAVGEFGSWLMTHAG